MPSDNHSPLNSNPDPNLNPAEVVRRMIEMLKTNENSSIKAPDITLETLETHPDDETPTKRVETISVEAVISPPPPPPPAPNPTVEKTMTEPPKPEPRTELRIDNLASEINRVAEKTIVTSQPSRALNAEPPWTLQQFFNGEIDLDVELTKRFPTMPMMSQIQFRTLGTTTGRRVATLSTQDGAASLIVDADIVTKTIQFSFTLGSMLTLRFSLSELSDIDRTRWLELMRREQGGLAFLWGQNRWINDYLICISRKNHINFYAFSPQKFDAGIRITPPIMKQLLAWLDEVWSSDDASNDEPPPLLTW